MADFKDHFNSEYVAWLSDVMGWAFDAKAISTELADLELKERVKLLASHLEALPMGVDEVLERGFGAPQTSGFNSWPFFQVIENFAHHSPHKALELLRRWTHRFSGEFAIRPALRADFDGAMDRLEVWRHDTDEHVRRLVSEGTRPKLPWGARVAQIDAAPSRVIALLRPLRHDPAEYVRRSVANHLNDWTKSHPTMVLDELEGWGDTPQENEIKRRALRTLVKAGDPRALALLGYGGELEVDQAWCDPVVDFPGDLSFGVSLRNPTEHTVRAAVDYQIFHAGSNRRGPKVFKWKTIEMAPGESVTLTRQHTFKPITTRRYYDGEHAWAVQVNGLVGPTHAFELRGVHGA